MLGCAYPKKVMNNVKVKLIILNNIMAKSLKIESVYFDR